MQQPDLTFFQALASASADATLPYFRTPLDIENKKDGGFDPVTLADRDAEKAIRALIAEHFPEHGIIGEEFGAERANADKVWIIDPVDGTRAFISGLPVWGTLVGYLEEGRAIAGMMAQPFTGELFVSVGGQSKLVLPDGSERVLRTRLTQALDEATLFTTDPALHQGKNSDAFSRLRSCSRLTRYGCDCYAFAMVALGQADMVVESGLQSYDIAGLIALIENAGGVVSTWDGARPEDGGDILASANPVLHEKALAVLAG